VVSDSKRISALESPGGDALTTASVRRFIRRPMKTLRKRTTNLNDESAQVSTKGDRIKEKTKGRGRLDKKVLKHL